MGRPHTLSKGLHPLTPNAKSIKNKNKRQMKIHQNDSKIQKRVSLRPTLYFKMCYNI